MQIRFTLCSAINVSPNKGDSKKFYLFFELAGMSIESTTRILTKFKSEGLINTKGKTFEILDAEKLVEISSKG